MQGKIYLIKNVDNNRIKIGCSGSPETRREQLRSVCGCELELLFETDFIRDVHLLEKYLHEVFMDCNFAGEWFDVDPDAVVKAIDEYGPEQIKLKELRSKGYSLRKIAEITGMSKSVIGRLLRGEKGFSKQTAEKLSKKAKSQNNILKKKGESKSLISKGELEKMVAANNAKRKKS
jgi:hypothetical protein